MFRAIDRMLEGQKALQNRIAETGGGIGIPGADRPEERAQFVRDMILSLEDELHEALNEIGWKPWQTSRHFNEDAYKAELVDAWHFFLNLMLVIGMDEDDLVAGYFDKRTKNLQRRDDGYDGVSGKCPECRRALDDKFTTCNPDIGWCMNQGSS